MLIRRKKQPFSTATTETQESVILGSQSAKSDGTTNAVEQKILDDLVLVGTYHLEVGPRQFGDWSELMVRDLGEGARPYLSSTYSLAVDRLVRCMIQTGDQLAYEVKTLRRRLSGTAIVAARGATVVSRNVAPDQSWQKLSPEGRRILLQEARAYLKEKGRVSKPTYNA